jgi:tetratricopeptide (TPR) repeat protein
MPSNKERMNLATWVFGRREWLLSACLCACTIQASEIDCGPLTNAYGPYDYTDMQHRAEKIPIVEGAHFNADVRTLRKGQSGVDPLGDIDYTLRAVPNHHPALDAVARYFAGGGNVHLIYGVYLHRRKQFAEAEQEYLRALELLGESADAHYDLGLLYADQAEWDRAKTHAIAAYRLAHPLQGLKRRLLKKGVWSAADDRAVAGSDEEPSAR